MGWEAIASVSYARVKDVQRAPAGFREWALERGAEGGAPTDADEDVANTFSTQFRAM